MKNYLGRIVAFGTALLLFSENGWAQFGPPPPPPPAGGGPPCWPPPCIPIDNQVWVLAAAGILLGAFLFWKKKQQTNAVSFEG